MAAILYAGLQNRDRNQTNVRLTSLLIIVRGRRLAPEGAVRLPAAHMAGQV